MLLLPILHSATKLFNAFKKSTKSCTAEMVVLGSNSNSRCVSLKGECCMSFGVRSGRHTTRQLAKDSQYLIPKPWQSLSVKILFVRSHQSRWSNDHHDHHDDDGEARFGEVQLGGQEAVRLKYNDCLSTWPPLGQALAHQYNGTLVHWYLGQATSTMFCRFD